MCAAAGRMTVKMQWLYTQLVMMFVCGAVMGAPMFRLEATIPEDGQSENVAAVRHRRSISSPNSLAELLQQVYNTPALDGDVLYSARRFCSLQFGFDYSVLAELGGYKALLQLYKLPYRNKDGKSDRRRSRSQRRRDRQNREDSGAEQARVTVYQVLDPARNNRVSIAMLDSQLVDVSSRGWVYYDVTSAIEDWAVNPERNLGLEVWIESATPGRKGVRWARKTKFVKPNSSSKAKIPELVITFDEDERNTLENIH